MTDTADSRRWAAALQQEIDELSVAYVKSAAKITASLRRLLQGGLGIFEGPFEVELEQRQLQLAGIRNTLVEQLAAVTRVHETARAAGGDA